jgi:hypothetical protein
LAALPVCVSCRLIERFEPSAPDGIRTHDLHLDRVASTTMLLCEGVCGNGSGGIRTLSISRSEREWSAGCLPSRYPGWDSNPHAPGFKPDRSASWRTWARRRKPWDSNPQAACAATCFQDRPLIRPVGFRDDRDAGPFTISPLWDEQLSSRPRSSSRLSLGTGV